MGIYRQDLHGQLNHQIELLKYKGIPSETAITIVDNDKRTIKVDCDAAFAEKYAKLDDFLVEIDARTVGDRDLNERIDGEIHDREQEDFNLGASIAAVNTNLGNRIDSIEVDIDSIEQQIEEEKAARIDADNELSQELANEKIDREAEDNNILGLIADEVRARSDADDALSNDIQQLSDRLAEESSARTRDDQVIRQSLQQEVQDRQDADSNLEIVFNSALQDEVAERLSGDYDLEQKIAEESEYRQQEDQVLGQSIEALQSDFNNSGIQNTDGYIDVQQLRGAKRFTVNASQQLLDLIRNKWSYQICTNAENTPEGVTWVDEQQQTITGTLVASADTMFKFYLVKDSGEGSDVYEEYITVFDEQNYSWEKFGGADIDLSNYAKLDNHDNVTEFIASQFIVSADESTIESASVSINSPSIAINSGGSILIDSSTEGNVSISGDSVSINSSSGGQTLSVNPNGAYLNGSEIAVRSDLNGYATEQWVEAQNYIVNGDGTVSTQNLANLSVATDKIANLAVTTAKIDDGAVNHLKTNFERLRIGASSNKLAAANALISGEDNHVAGKNSTARGINNQISGLNSHAEGKDNQIASSNAHAEGNGNKVLSGANNSHAEGYNNTVSNNQAHAEGSGTTASGNSSHSEGSGTIAASGSQHAQGKYNIEDSNGLYADIVGWGTSSERKNISALTTSGTLRLAGDAYVGCNNDSTGGLRLATEEWVLAHRVQLNTYTETEIDTDVYDAEIDCNGGDISIHAENISLNGNVVANSNITADAVIANDFTLYGNASISGGIQTQEDIISDSDFYANGNQLVATQNWVLQHQGGLHTIEEEQVGEDFYDLIIGTDETNSARVVTPIEFQDEVEMTHSLRTSSLAVNATTSELIVSPLNGVELRCGEAEVHVYNDAIRLETQQGGINLVSTEDGDIRAYSEEGDIDIHAEYGNLSFYGDSVRVQSEGNLSLEGSSITANGEEVATKDWVSIRVPDASTLPDGDYTLACVVSNHQVTYSWVERIKADSNNMIVS